MMIYTQSDASTADVAFSDLVRRTFGPALFTGDWPRDASFLSAIHLVEDMDWAETKDDEIHRHDIAMELVALARGHAPDLLEIVLPKVALAA